MPVIDLQKRLRQIGRIRIGYSEKGNKGGREYKTPKRSQTFILTSSDRRALEVAAGKYGGSVAPWPEQQGQFILTTDRNEIPVLVARMAPDTQWYEHWNAGECLRRCNGAQQENGKACQCPADPKARAEAAKSFSNPACKLITRVSVMLPEVPDLGVWRLDTHGYYAATELPTTLEAIWMIAPTAEFAPAFIGIEPRKSGKKSWLTPVLRLKQTSEELHEIEASGGSFFARPQLGSPDAPHARRVEAPAAVQPPRATATEAEDDEDTVEADYRDDAAGQPADLLPRPVASLTLENVLFHTPKSGWLQCGDCGFTVAQIPFANGQTANYNADGRRHETTCAAKKPSGWDEYFEQEGRK